MRILKNSLTLIATFVITGKKIEDIPMYEKRKRVVVPMVFPENYEFEVELPIECLQELMGRD